MLKLFISKSGNCELNEQERTVLAVLNGLQCNKHDYLFTSLTEIAYTITGRWINIRNKDRRLYENIRKGIQSLADRGIITVLDQNGDNYVISNDGLQADTENGTFIVVELWEMQKIFSQANKPFDVFTFFVNLVGTINNTTKEWHMSQDDMASNWKCSKRTVNSYLEQLEEMQLIYVYRHNKRKSDGTYHKLNNSYGRYKDKEFVIKAAQDYAESVECEDFYENIDRRSIKLRYNAFCNGAKKYNCNPDAVLDLYKECQLYNKSLKSKPIEKMYDGEYKEGEPLDLMVFPDDIIDSYNEKSTDDQWGKPDPMMYDFSVEEMLDMPTMGEIQSEPCILQSKGDSRKFDREQFSQNSSTTVFNSEKLSQNSSKAIAREDLHLIDIDSLFDNKTESNKSNKIVLTREEAEELFA